MIFFCLTGITLNHRWYHLDGNRLLEEEKSLSAEDVLRWKLTPSDNWQPDISAINEDIRAWFHLPLPHSIDVDEGVGELAFDFKVPAGYAYIYIDANAAMLTLEKESGSFIGIVNDLHKGRHSGTVWFWVIDISAVLLTFFSVTGLIILYQGRRFKRNGNLLLVAGLITPCLIYWIFVPNV